MECIIMQIRKGQDEGHLLVEMESPYSFVLAQQKLLFMTKYFMYMYRNPTRYILYLSLILLYNINCILNVFLITHLSSKFFFLLSFGNMQSEMNK